MIAISMTARIESRRSPESERFAALNREATQATARSYDEAVALLYEAKAIKGDYYDETRLAKFLQHAGRLDDALAEIHWLLDRVHLHLDQLPHLNAVQRQSLRVSTLVKIYDAARLICERAEREDLYAHYVARRDDYARLGEKLDTLMSYD